MQRGKGKTFGREKCLWLWGGLNIGYGRLVRAFKYRFSVFFLFFKYTWLKKKYKNTCNVSLEIENICLKLHIKQLYFMVLHVNHFRKYFSL